ncbi:hypothetical protein K7X08_011339 [Anisodus acutangulus]|uniref:Uncharacterized protein n=1 Tax=Anisodus acutangulus TaxID=402998 RepID=A0A9Q1LZS2_9SOLA|nr:hypothetical protein K7X08_011339 [Anisodus acutangulus]
MHEDNMRGEKHQGDARENINSDATGVQKHSQDEDLDRAATDEYETIAKGDIEAAENSGQRVSQTENENATGHHIGNSKSLVNASRIGYGKQSRSLVVGKDKHATGDLNVANSISVNAILEGEGDDQLAILSGNVAEKFGAAAADKNANDLGHNVETRDGKIR